MKSGSYTYNDYYWHSFEYMQKLQKLPNIPSYLDHRKIAFHQFNLIHNNASEHDFNIVFCEVFVDFHRCAWKNSMKRD
jgi:chemotaxis methyl-accepting protein methylase